ncbi:Hypothetical protein A7982_08229 [Minicystis rosea]|nr:Hypothetical protein A7982_08229 [Minicystis rosea]
MAAFMAGYPTALANVHPALGTALRRGAGERNTPLGRAGEDVGCLGDFAFDNVKSTMASFVGLIRLSTLAAALASAGCVEVKTYSVRLEEPEVQKVRERLQSAESRWITLQTSAGHTVVDSDMRIVQTRSDGGPVADWMPPKRLEEIALPPRGGMEVMFYAPVESPSRKRVATAGKYTLIAGGGAFLTGLGLVGIGFATGVGIKDESGSGRGGTIPFVVGLGHVAVGLVLTLVGGSLAIAGHVTADSPKDPRMIENLGFGFVR